MDFILRQGIFWLILRRFAMQGYIGASAAETGMDVKIVLNLLDGHGLCLHVIGELGRGLNGTS